MKIHLKTTFDFVIEAETCVPGIVLIHPLHEDAYNYLADECDFHVNQDGTCPLDKLAVGDFISDSENAHFVSQYS